MVSAPWHLHAIITSSSQQTTEASQNSQQSLGEPALTLHAPPPRPRAAEPPRHCRKPAGNAPSAGHAAGTPDGRRPTSRLPLAASGRPGGPGPHHRPACGCQAPQQHVAAPGPHHRQDQPLPRGPQDQRPRRRQPQQHRHRRSAPRQRRRRRTAPPEGTTPTPGTPRQRQAPSRPPAQQERHPSQGHPATPPGASSPTPALTGPRQSPGPPARQQGHPRDPQQTPPHPAQCQTASWRRHS